MNKKTPLIQEGSFFVPMENGFQECKEGDRIHKLDSGELFITTWIKGVTFSMKNSVIDKVIIWAEGSWSDNDGHTVSEEFDLTSGKFEVVNCGGPSTSLKV